jgi:predicted dehydrogenase
MARFKSAADIKVGVIGYGGAFNMGRHHLNEMKQAGMTPTAVAEIDKSRLAVATSDFPGIATFTSVDEMLKKSDVNLLAIITPHNTHAKLALQCLKAGRHVVAEKPLAITTAECDAMISEAKKKKLVLSTYHNRHWDGVILSALKTIGSGAIGEVRHIKAHMGGYAKPGDWWRTSRTISGGVLYDWGVHLLEYSLQLLGDDDIVEVSGFAHNGYWANQTPWKKDTNEDEASAFVRFKSGRRIELTITQLDAVPRPNFVQITGTKGSYLMTVGEGQWEMIQPKADGTTVITRGQSTRSEGWKLYQNVADHLVKGEKLIITGEWSRRPIHILDLACRSAKANKTLSAKYK